MISQYPSLNRNVNDQKFISTKLLSDIGAGHFIKFALGGEGVSPQSNYKDFIRFRSSKHF